MHKTQISIIQVPLWYGSEKRGVELAPDMLSKAILNSDINNYIADNITIPTPEVEIKASAYLHDRYLDAITDIDKQLAMAVYHQLSQGVFALTIGGDHSIGLGSVAGSLQYDNNVGLIWFDAHGDMNTEATSPTGHIHGMPVAALMGFCSSKLNEVASIHIKPENIFGVGARSLDKGEKELVEKLHLNVYSTDYIHQVGMKAVIQDIHEKMAAQHIEHLHLSFDVDAFDPQLFPATGVPEQDGLLMEDFDEFTSVLPTLPKMIALDFVEYNPLLDDKDNKCLALCIYYIVNILLSIHQ